MKFVRFGPRGRERVGAVDGQGQLRDLSAHCADLNLLELGLSGLRRLSRVNLAGCPVVKGRPRLGVPYTGIGKFVAIGLNYRDHALEAGLPIPSEPIIFMKATSCLTGPNDPIELPPQSIKTDWEVELGVVIGRKAKNVPASQALAHVAGYCVVNDVSEREWQMERGLTWDKGKGFDSFGPVGPWLVTPDEVGDPQKLELWLNVNGQTRQRGSTSSMIFTVTEIVSYVSRCMTLWPGDLICTGTPPGVGMGLKPQPQFLRKGDVVTLGIQGLGEQRQRVTSPWAED